MNKTGTAKPVNNGSEDVMKIKLQFYLKEKQKSMANYLNKKRHRYR